MTKTNTRVNLEKNPTLSEVLLIEKTLQDSNESIVTTFQLKKLVHGKINKNTLTIILDYLEEENKIIVTSKGITWIKSKKKLLEVLGKLPEKNEITDDVALRMGREINKNVTRKLYNSLKQDKKNQPLKKLQRKRQKKRDTKRNKILKKDDFLSLEKL